MGLQECTGLQERFSALALSFVLSSALYYMPLALSALSTHPPRPFHRTSGTRPPSSARVPP